MRLACNDLRDGGAQPPLTVDFRWIPVVALSGMAISFASVFTVGGGDLKWMETLACMFSGTVVSLLIRFSPSLPSSCRVPIRQVCLPMVVWAFACIAGALSIVSRNGTVSYGLALASAVFASVGAILVAPLLGKVISWRRALMVSVNGAVLGCGAWLVAKFVADLWYEGFMVGATFKAVVWVLGHFFHDIASAPAEALLRVNDFEVVIHAPCSGYEGVGLVAGFLTLLLVVNRRGFRFPQALALLPIGMGLSWTLNVLRIVGCVSLGACGYPEIAVGGFHTEAGWLAFCAVAVGVTGLGLAIPWFRAPYVNENHTKVEFSENDALTAFLMPIIVLLSVALLSRAASDGGFDRYYPFRTAAVLLVITVYWREYVRLGWTFSGMAFPIGAGLVIFFVWVAYGEWHETPSGLPMELAQMQSWKSTVWLAARIFGACVTVPLAEELAFRGVLLPALLGSSIRADIRIRFRWWAALVTAIAFGFLHSGWELPGMLAGLAYAAVYARSGRLADAIVAHAVSNTAIVAWALAFQRWNIL